MQANADAATEMEPNHELAVVGRSRVSRDMMLRRPSCFELSYAHCPLDYGAFTDAWEAEKFSNVLPPACLQHSVRVEKN